jgi:hypothetical protein
VNHFDPANRHSITAIGIKGLTCRFIRSAGSEVS